MSSQLEARGDRKVTPGVTGSSRARAPIDPAVWYLRKEKVSLTAWGRTIAILSYVSAYNGGTLELNSESGVCVS